MKKFWFRLRSKKNGRFVAKWFEGPIYKEKVAYHAVQERKAGKDHGRNRPRVATSGKKSRG